ncbi:MAG TPA: hypothetical protein PKE69_18595 [Pyrinomonadaceae bacterium]|nr:hypothetical protein [Pyrinomonadaceae bacterium]
MNVAVRKLKSLDSDLNFQVDHEIEQKNFGNDGIDRSSFLRGIQKLEKDGKVATIFVYWTNEGVFPKFMDITVMTSADQEKYATPSVSYNKISEPEKY